MKRLKNLFLLSTIILFLPLLGSRKYYQEFKALKKNGFHEIIFDEYANSFCRNILTDITVQRELGYFQRLIRSFCSWNVLITAETMPKLYSYINSICTKHNIKTPAIFLMQDRGTFNAFAGKLLMSSGGIVIGQDILKELTDEEIEAVVAHELGHIKYNHTNKKLLIICVPFLVPLIIGKRYERQADKFAYQDTKKGKGLIKFFKRLQEKDEKRENNLKLTRATLRENKDQLAFFDYYCLLLRYYVAKGGHKINNVYRWIYHHTPFGAHPSHESRIKKVEKYLAVQAELGLLPYSSDG